MKFRRLFLGLYVVKGAVSRRTPQSLVKKTRKAILKRMKRLAIDTWGMLLMPRF